MEAIGVIVVAMLLIVLPMAYFGVAKENTDICIRRGRYALTFLGLLAAAVILQAIADVTQSPEFRIAAPFILYGINFYLLRLTVKRLRDMGHSRNYAYLLLIPIIGVLACLVFCCLPSRAPADSDIVRAF